MEFFFNLQNIYNVLPACSSFEKETGYRIRASRRQKAADMKGNEMKYIDEIACKITEIVVVCLPQIMKV